MTKTPEPRSSMLDAMMAYVRQTLAPNDYESTKSTVTLFRRRSEHSLRVLRWAETLAPEFPDLDLEMLQIAAIFHDVGYATCANKKEHAAESARLCDLYLKGIHFDVAKAQNIVAMVARHSDKHLLASPETPIELKVLMEADILDETGAMAVLWDCLVQGQKPEQSYDETYRHIVAFTGQSLKSNPLRSATGRRIWEEKRVLVDAFLASLERDLCVARLATP